MRIGEPKLDQREPQHYVGIRTQVSHTEFPKIIPEYIDELFGWLGQRGIAPAGPPLMRYYVINMPGRMDVELGIPVATPVQGDDRVKPGIIPAGRYASLIYTGLDGVPGNAALIGWAQENGIEWDRWDDPSGDAFRSRVEYFLTGPDDNPDPDTWESEVTILTRS